MGDYEKYRYPSQDSPPAMEALGHPNREFDGAPSRYHGIAAGPWYSRASNANISTDIDVFGREEEHQIKYKTLSWQMVAALMIAEIVSNGMLSLPSAVAVVGLVPGVILIIFLGVFATFTSWVLIQFKLRHPATHNMGDAGLIIFGPIGREAMALGTVVFAVFASGSQLLAGQISLAALSDNKLCLMLYTGIFAIPTLIMSFPRTLDNLSWLSVLSCFSILIAGIVGMAGAGANPVSGRTIDATAPTSFVNAFVAITNPVFAYAGHFMVIEVPNNVRRSLIVPILLVLHPHI